MVIDASKQTKSVHVWRPIASSLAKQAKEKMEVELSNISAVKKQQKNGGDIDTYLAYVSHLKGVLKSIKCMRGT